MPPPSSVSLVALVSAHDFFHRRSGLGGPTKEKRMIARCPRCEKKGTVFVRSADGADLVCKEDT